MARVFAVAGQDLVYADVCVNRLQWAHNDEGHGQVSVAWIRAQAASAIENLAKTLKACDRAEGFRE